MEQFFSMFSEYKYILILCVFVGIVSFVLYIIRLIAFPRRRDYENYDNEDDSLISGVMEDFHNAINNSNDDRFYNPPDLEYKEPKSIDNSTLENLINHLEERINECNDEKQLEILTRKRDEYQRRLDNNI